MNLNYIVSSELKYLVSGKMKCFCNFTGRFLEYGDAAETFIEQISEQSFFKILLNSNLSLSIQFKADLEHFEDASKEQIINVDFSCIFLEHFQCLLHG